MVRFTATQGRQSHNFAHLHPVATSGVFVSPKKVRTRIIYSHDKCPRPPAYCIYFRDEEEPWVCPEASLRLTTMLCKVTHAIGNALFISRQKAGISVSSIVKWLFGSLINYACLV